MDSPPLAPRLPTRLVAHGDVRVDEWYWLRNREDPEVLRHLEAENRWAEAATTNTAELCERLFEEIRSRAQETDATAPLARGPWWYYDRTVEGLAYPIHCRRRRAAPDEAAAGALVNGSFEEVVLDENVLAEGHAYFALAVLGPSPDHRFLAYSTDVNGDEAYTLRVRDLAIGADLDEAIPGTSYGMVWAADGKTLFYTTIDRARRPWRVYRHRLGTDPDADTLVYQEDDKAFHLGLDKTRSQAWVLIVTASMVTSEVLVVPADEPEGPPRLVAPRRHGVRYDVEHHGDRFLILTNDEAENFRLMEAPVVDPGSERWRELVPHRPDVRLLGVDAFAGHLVLHERAAALTRLRVLRLADGEVHTLEQPEPVHTVGPGANFEFATTTLRFHYTSLVTPEQAVDYDLETKSRSVVKQQPVPGYDPGRYRTERRWATAPDGTAVPISIAYRTDRRRDDPALLYGYGAYEASIEPAFSPILLSLLDRGFAFAIAHVRGGGELGRRWYEQGKLLRKRNTFSDFVACAEQLIGEGWTTPDRLVARGGSAGGLLVGAVANMRPDLFRAMVAEVPFVDCLTSMLDESLPLTVIEWDEWGNPVADPEAYAYVKSYSPYDNVEAKAYPALLVRAGLNDPRVGFWEPAKWVAKLRALKTDDNLLVLKVDLSAGHGGPSGRYDAWRDEAGIQAFILAAVGIGEQS